MSAEEERVPKIVKEDSDEPVDLERGDIEDYNKEVTEQNAEPRTASQETQCCTPMLMKIFLAIAALVVVVTGVTLGIYFGMKSDGDESAPSDADDADDSSAPESAPSTAEAPPMAPEIVLFALNLCGAHVDPPAVADELRIWMESITPGATMKQEACPIANPRRRLLQAADIDLDFSIVTRDQAVSVAFEAVTGTDAGAAFQTHLMDSCTAEASSRTCRTAQVVSAAIDFARGQDGQAGEGLTVKAACDIFVEHTLLNVKRTWLADINVAGGEFDATAFRMTGMVGRLSGTFESWDTDEVQTISDDELRSGLRKYIVEKGRCPSDAGDGKVTLEEFNADYMVLPRMPNMPKNHEICISFSNTTSAFGEEGRNSVGTWRIDPHPSWGPWMKLDSAYVMYYDTCTRSNDVLKWRHDGTWEIGTLVSSEANNLGLTSGAEWERDGELAGLITITEGACVDYSCQVCASNTAGVDPESIAGTYNSKTFEQKWYKGNYKPRGRGFGFDFDDNEGAASQVSDESDQWIFTSTSTEAGVTSMNLGDHNYTVTYGRCVPETMCLSFVTQLNSGRTNYGSASTFTAHFNLQSAAGRTSYVYHGSGGGKQYTLEFAGGITNVLGGEWVVKDRNTEAKIASQYVSGDDVFGMAFDNHQWREYVSGGLRPTMVNQCS